MSTFDIRPYPRKPLIASPAEPEVPIAPRTPPQRVHTTDAQITVWKYLSSVLRPGPRVVSTTELAAETGLLKHTVLYQIKALERRGAIRRVRRCQRGFELELLKPYGDES